MCGKIRHERSRNDNIRDKVVVAPIVEKNAETWPRWFGHIERRLVDSVVSRVDHMEGSQITRGRGRPKKTIRKILRKF